MMHRIKPLEFLKHNGIDCMVAIESDQYDHVGVFDFVTEKDGVRIIYGFNQGKSGFR